LPWHLLLPGRFSSYSWSWGAAASIGPRRRRLHSRDKAYQGIGGEECLLDRLLRDCDQKRTPREERKAQNLALKRDHNDDDDDMSRILFDQGDFSVYPNGVCGESLDSAEITIAYLAQSKL
jgi:hypothetical protein